MRTSRPFALPFFALLTLPALASAQESVTLDFNWPAGSALVTITTSISMDAAGQTNDMDTGMSYRLNVTEAPEGLRIGYSDFTVDGMEMDELMAGEGGPEGLSRALSNAQPDILVTDDGEFIDLVDYEALRASMEEMMAPMREQMGAQGMGAMFDEMVEGSVSRETVTRNAELGWNQIAGFWAGRTMETGETVTIPAEVTLPMMGNEPMVMDTELQFRGRVDCPPGSPSDGGCLELTMSTSPDPEEMRNLMDVFMANMMEQAGGSGMQMFITQLEMETTSTLIVEAATLRPLVSETVMDMTMGMDVMGSTQTVVNHQVVETLYDWGS